MYAYAWYHWLTFFYIYCFLGWIFESGYVSLKQRRFVNRGFLRLPLIPLYGTGAVMMLWVSLPFQENLVLVYLSGFVAATVLEYVTGWGMETLFQVRYWDYSNQKFNLNGYVCLSSSLVWGFLTIFLTECIHRPIAGLVLRLPVSLEWELDFVVTILFAADTIHSVREALQLAKSLQAISRLREELEHMQAQLSLLKAMTAQNLHALRENVEDSALQSKERLGATKESLEESLKTAGATLAESALASRERIAAVRESLAGTVPAPPSRESLEARILAVSQRLSQTSESLKKRTAAGFPDILRRNPTAASRRFAAALRELQEGRDHRKR